MARARGQRRPSLISLGDSDPMYRWCVIPWLTGRETPEEMEAIERAALQRFADHVRRKPKDKPITRLTKLGCCPTPGHDAMLAAVRPHGMFSGVSCAALQEMYAVHTGAQPSDKRTGLKPGTRVGPVRMKDGSVSPPGVVAAFAGVLDSEHMLKPSCDDARLMVEQDAESEQTEAQLAIGDIVRLGGIGPCMVVISEEMKISDTPYDDCEARFRVAWFDSAGRPQDGSYSAKVLTRASGGVLLQAQMQALVG